MKSTENTKLVIDIDKAKQILGQYHKIKLMNERVQGEIEFLNKLLDDSREYKVITDCDRATVV